MGTETTTEAWEHKSQWGGGTILQNSDIVLASSYILL